MNTASSRQMNIASTSLARACWTTRSTNWRLEMSVAFVEEHGDKGPQASTVRVLGKHHYTAP